jgi:glutamate synthase (NADPH/NADH) small chain
MAKHSGFLEYDREDVTKLPVAERIRSFKEFEQNLPEDRLKQQASRCMDCGIPHCHTFGCPVKNRIPDWNDLVYRSHWKKALELLQSTDNFPEFTGRICPAPCETACTLAINQKAVSIRQIELQIVERGWKEGWIQPEPASYKSGKKVAIIGSGPAGLAAAQVLARYGHEVIVFERANRIGGLLRYGIPDFKLEKWVIDRRLEQMKAEGVTFETSVEAGNDLSVKYMQRSFDAIVIAGGATAPRDLQVPGRQMQGIHFAMDFLTQQNKRVAGDSIADEALITAEDKHVIVLGGGDTGSDCVGTSKRQGARTITQIELLPMPPHDRAPENPWPTWPTILRTSSSHEEGCERLWSFSAKEALGENGKVKALKFAKLDWSEKDASGRPKPKEVCDSEVERKADLVLLAMGFVHVEHGPLVDEAGLKIDNRGNIVVDANLMTSAPGIFAAGDSVMGASLVVRALHHGRKAAEGVERYLSA